MRFNFLKIFLLTLLGLIGIVSLCFAAEVSYFIYDSPGRSVIAVVDSAQTTINSYSYTDFGKVASQNESTGNVHKYNGEQYESESDLTLNRDSDYY